MAAEKFSDAEIEKLYNEIRYKIPYLEIGNISDEEYRNLFLAKLKEIVGRVLAEKGMSFPTSQSELLRQTEGVGVKQPIQ
ncbi:hypothetical protein HY621_03445 [Candidatus Uhrbacteria bacterium]|nr:hypothetical protein [Candidatus Uhrbacteria bacterium]